ncbi:MAG: hypothetical protein IT514_04185 [Burkholderiales bacterium]|nr:hypothetical protein [Burkholderiales bacterium]
MLMWGSITFAAGIVLIAIEIWQASKKKGGVTPTDKRRIWGIFQVTCVLTLVVAGLIWMAD